MMGLVSYFRAKSESLVLIAVILIAHREFRYCTVNAGEINVYHKKLICTRAYTRVGIR